jgi:HSP20 family protein
MAITRWEPFQELVTTHDRLNRLFNEAFARTFQGTGEEVLGSGTWVPPVDIYETQNDLVLQAELPGIEPNDVEVRVEDNTLYLKGERKFQGEVKDETFHRRERAYGVFTRSFALPGFIDAEKVSAEYKNGVLTVTLPKREEAKPKTIKIQVDGQNVHQQVAAGSRR